MAKNQTQKKPAAKATNKKAAAKPKNNRGAKKAEPFQFELDSTETKAFELAQSSDQVRNDLEEAATQAISLAVRKVFKQHGVTLKEPQAQRVAVVLFGD